MAGVMSLLKDFASGQGLGSSYVAYAPDHDLNYTQIETLYNALNAEVAALGGGDSALIFDLLLSTSPAVTQGRLDSNSYAITFQSGNTLVALSAGAAYTVANGRIATTVAPPSQGSSGGAGARFVALQANGTFTVETLANQGVLDLYGVNWTGAAFDPTTVTYIADIIPAGDDTQNARIADGEAGGGDKSGLPARTYERIANRLRDLDRIMQGRFTSVETTPGGSAISLGRIAISGSEAAPGIIVGDGVTGTYETGTGLYRIAADTIGVSIAGTLSHRFGPSGQRTSPTQGRAAATATNFSLVNNALTSVTLDAEAYDVGGYITPPSATMSVPSGDYAGSYTVRGFVQFDESTSAGTPNSGEREVVLLAGGTTIARARVNACAAGDTALAVVGDRDLTGGASISIQAFQNSGGAMNVNARLSLRLED